jgi:hypothetical protein
MVALLALLLTLTPVPKARQEYTPPKPSAKSTAEELVWWSSTGARFIKAISLIDNSDDASCCIIAGWVYSDLCNAFDSDDLAEKRLWVLRHAREVLGGPSMWEDR